MSKFFGPDEDSWNIDDVGLSENEGFGKPGIGLFGRAIQVWTSMQDEDQTVKQAAAAFNCEEEMIRQAVDAHYWMLIVNDTIEHEGV